MTGYWLTGAAAFVTTASAGFAQGAIPDTTTSTQTITTTSLEEQW